MPVTAARDENASLERLFLLHYARITRVVARLVRDRGRAEEVSVEVFLKWRHHNEAHGDGAPGWLYRTAMRMGLDELRRQTRRARFEAMVPFARRSPKTPADVHDATAEQHRVRVVLASMRRRDAALLVLRSDGLSYEEVAAALRLKPSSVGTLISRAQRAFREDYVRRYGTHQPVGR